MRSETPGRRLLVSSNLLAHEHVSACCFAYMLEMRRATREKAGISAMNFVAPKWTLHSAANQMLDVRTVRLRGLS